MIKNIVSCGCSYVAGAGYYLVHKERLSALFAKKYNANDINFAIDGGSNDRIVRKITNWDSRSIFVTSDHGSTISNRPVIIKGDKSTSTGIRYKVGRSLHVNKKDAMIIRNPKEYKLLSEGINSNYIIAKNNNFFIYPNKKNKYQHLYSDSFQHGGISMEEMIIPVISLKSKS